MIRVYGFPRSGNHMLADLVARHLYANEDTSARIRNTATGHWSQRGAVSPVVVGGEQQDSRDFVSTYAKCLGTHRLPGSIPGSRWKIYVYRDGRDVASSLYAWPQVRHVDAPDIPFGQFIRQNLDWRNSPGGKAPPKRNYSLIHHWRDHLKTWSKAPKTILVRYEDVLLNPVNEIHKVAAVLGVPVAGVPSTSSQVGWNPSGDHRIRKWQSTWDRRDLAYFDAVVPAHFFGRFDSE